MTNFQVFFAPLLVVHVGWTLLHFLWQGALISALYAVVRGLSNRWMSAPARYALACSTLALMALAPIFTYAWLASDTWRSALQGAALPPSQATWGDSLPAAVPWYVLGLDNLQRALPWLVIAWLAGVVVFLIRLVRATLFATRLRSRGTSPAPHYLDVAFNRIAAQLRVAHPVRLLLSSIVDVPVVIGWLRPLVLMPAAALTGLAPHQIEALLAHELAHIRRHDYLVNVLQRAIEAVLFYHPAVWWVSNQIRRERELCCDDLAVAASGDALSYAHALADLESSRPAHRTAAIAANGGSLTTRIRRLVGDSQPASHTTLAGVTAFAVTLIVLFAVGTAAVKAAQNAAGRAGVVERNAVWLDTVKRGDMPLQVRGHGVLTTNTVADLRVPMSMWKRVEPGQAVSLAFPPRKEIVTGKVTATSAGATDGGVAVQLTGSIPPGVQHGAEVDAAIELGLLKNVVWVGRPVKIEPNSTGDLFKLDRNGTQAVRVKVEFGQASINMIQILSGLDPGDQVIVSDMAPFQSSGRITLK